MRFLQSAGGFPCMVELGRDSPSWELRRWGRDVLRFCPVQRDRYAVRGSTRQLLYRGERESHRFTILDADHFEYDLILKKRPESNTITLFLEGWEGFDFFRQPDRFGPEPLRGSYAVYKKEFVLNSEKYHVGTGKFCHIHRPKIIDALGREVWGDLRIVRGVLTIDIPEGWLGEAAYPVVVDPVIGSNTIGAYRTFPYMSSSDYEYYLRDLAKYPNNTDVNDYCEDGQIYLEEWIALNRQTTPLALQGTYNAYLYADESWPYGDSAAHPMLYSSLNNKPKQILFSDTSYMAIRVNASTPAKWNKGTITFGTRINADTDIWFGFAGDIGIGCRFDYGCQYMGVHGYYPPDGGDYQDAGFETIVEYIADSGYDDLSKKPDWLSDSGASEPNVYPGARNDFKISMYLELPPQQYTRTVTQGVRLTDSGKRVHGIVKKLLQTVRIDQTGKRVQEAFRKTAETVMGTAATGRFGGFYRKCVMDVKNTLLLKQEPFFIRTVIEQIKAAMSTGKSLEIKRDVENPVSANCGMVRTQGIYRNVLNLIHTGDRIIFPVFISRFVYEWLQARDSAGRWGDYLRGLFVEAGSSAETLRRGEYYRKQQDMAYSEAVPLRHLFVFIRLMTGAFIRDYLIGRFLKSREEVVIKSPVCREITLESKI